MQNYRIITPVFVCLLSVEHETVQQSGQVLGWSVGKDFSTVRDYCRDRGWIVEPLPDKLRWIEYDGVMYEFVWSDEGVLKRVTKHIDGKQPVDIKFSSLPKEVRYRV